MSEIRESRKLRHKRSERNRKDWHWRSRRSPPEKNRLRRARKNGRSLTNRLHMIGQ